MIENLEEKLQQWVSSELKESVDKLQLIPGGASRRSYKVSMSNGDNYFLRVDTGEGPLSGTEMNLSRERQFIDPVARLGKPVPGVIAYNDELSSLLMEHVPGFNSYQKTLDNVLQREVEKSLIGIIADMHTLDIAELQLPDHKNRATVGPAVNQALAMWQKLYDERVSFKDPAIDFILHWLKNNIPDQNRDSVLVHGDVGPGNFLFTDSGKVSALIDWELAHIGHPLEDLACILCRALGVDFGSGDQLVADYEAATGMPVDRSTLDYCVILMLSEWCVGINMALSRTTVNQDVAMLFVWGHINRYALLEKLASFQGISMPPTPVVGVLGMEWDFLPGYVGGVMEEVILPNTDDAFTRQRLQGLIQLQHVQSALLAYGSERYCNEEIEWARKLTGKQYSNYEGAHQALIDRAIPAAEESDQEYMSFLLWRAARERALLATAAGPMADRKISY